MKLNRLKIERGENVLEFIFWYLFGFVLTLTVCLYLDETIGIRRNKAGIRVLLSIAALWPATVPIFLILVAVNVLKYWISQK